MKNPKIRSINKSLFYTLTNRKLSVLLSVSRKAYVCVCKCMRDVMYLVDFHFFHWLATDFFYIFFKNFGKNIILSRKYRFPALWLYLINITVWQHYYH